MKFVICTKDFSGLGFAMRLQDEGHTVLVAYKGKPEEMKDPEVKETYMLVGKGIVNKAPLLTVMKNRSRLRSAYFIWDGNHNVDENEKLRSEGFKVFGGGTFADTMEHDRDAALDFAEQYGLMSPPSYPFTDTASAIAFCEQNPETAYVFKPDEGENFETWVPESEMAEDANKELVCHLQSLQGNGSFILQERKEGVETNVEVWFTNGEPKFAFMCIESKKKDVGDLGEMVGCAFDFTFTIPLNCKAVRESVGKLFPAYKKMNYTGFADANFIAAKDGVWFFEKCERFGYNSHPNLLWNLNQDELGDTLASLIDGTFEPNFTPGFGASVTFQTDHPKTGKAVQFPEKLYKDMFFWDVYRDGDQYLTAGYDNNVLICTGFGYTIPTAWENCMSKADKIKFPNRRYRNDGDKTNFFSSPIRRYEALDAMNYFE